MPRCFTALFFIKNRFFLVINILYIMHKRFTTPPNAGSHHAAAGYSTFTCFIPNFWVLWIHIMSKNNYKIGFIIDNIDRAWAQSVWPSFAKSALKENQSLFIFPGGRLKSKYLSNNLRNSIYSLVNSENLDGLICWSTTIKDKNVSDDEFLKFHSGFEPLPYVTLADKIPGHPCVNLDVYTGMKQLVAHCIEVHGAKKIAFLRGPANHYHSVGRLMGYNDAMKEAGLPVMEDSPLITVPFAWEEGDKAAAQLFEERKLKPGEGFDTIVGANDEMVIKAIKYFSYYGYHVPRDYYALGFDNSVESLLCECPLSTVMVPYSEMSKESFRVLMKHMQKNGSYGNGPVEDVLLPSKPVIRESCGCGRLYYHRIDPLQSAAKQGSAAEALIAKIADQLGVNENNNKPFLMPLIRAWQMISPENDSEADSQSSEEEFLVRFEDAVAKFLNFEGEADLLFKLLNNIAGSGLVSASQFSKFEPAMLWIIFKVRERSAIYDQFKREERNAALNYLQFELLETIDRNSMIESLARNLSKIGIGSAGVVLYSGHKKSLWVGSYSPEGISPVKEQFFPAKHIVPMTVKHHFSRGVFMIQPLFIEDRSLGYLIHSVSNYDGVIYEDIRTTVSYALKGIFQFEEMARAQQKVLESMEQSRILTLQKEAAQAASDAKSQFLANVSHEIRTPMNAILGMSELMLSENLNLRHRQYMEDIKTSALALLEIINQILDLSKLQSGKMNLIPVHYDFKAMIDNICSMVRFLIKNENVAFKVDMQGDIPKFLYGDNVRLRQILLNLLGNAVKFTRAGFINLYVLITGTDIHFTIRDTGVGIKKEDIAELFETFKQVDVVKNRDNKGTGLGLAITKTLVEMMNGSIKVESVYGQGSVFRVIIPKVLGDGAQIHSAGSGARVSCSPDTKILVVDDNTINLNVISGLLQLCGVSAFTALSGRQAIEMVRENKYDLIFMDHMMPEMDGVETLKFIRNLGINTPIVALTANAVTSAKEMLLAAGMNDFISKPIVKEELNGILLKWIPGSKLINTEDGDSYDNSGHDKNAKFWMEFCSHNGISMHLGLERVSGRMDAYENLLKSLIKEIEKCTANMREFMVANDMYNFSIEAHSMKSSLANIGAMELSSKAHELESASSRKDIGFCTLNLKSFTDELCKLGSALSNAFSELYHDKVQAAVSSDLALILSRMRNSVIDMKYEEINTELKNLETLSLGGTLEDEIEEIKDAIMIMDYESATKKIKKLLKK